MPITEAERSDLYTGLREVLGASRAETLMSAIPLYDLDEVATKRDLAVLRAEMTGDFAKELSMGLGTQRSELHHEIRTLRSELHHEIGRLRSELHSEIETFRRSVEKRFDRLLYAMIAMPIGIIGTFVAILRYLD